MGLFKILLGPIGMGLPFRPTSKRERFQYQSVAAANETNQLLERLIETVESGTPGVVNAPSSGTSFEEFQRRQLEQAKQAAKKIAALLTEWKVGATFTAQVRWVIGDGALFRTDEGLPFGFNALGHETYISYDTLFAHDLKGLEIDMSEFGTPADMHKFLKAGNRAKFLVTKVEQYEPILNLKSITDKIQDPNNRRNDPQRSANQRTRYKFKLIGIIETGLEDAVSFTVGDIIIGELTITTSGDNRVELPDGRIIELANRHFSAPYRVREGTSMFWLVETGAQVWLKVLPPQSKRFGANSYSFKVIPPPASE
jgi:hypothetical protein